MQFDPETRLGFVGLGIMGVPLVERLAKKGYSVSVWNREPERFEAVSPFGTVWRRSPADVWEASDLVFLCVLGDGAIDDCVSGKDGFVHATRHARLLVDLSTTSTEKTLSAAETLAAKTGAGWIDAPMSGGPQAASEGTLTLMIGGADENCDAAMPLLQAIAANITRMGPLGSGQKTKMLNQAAVGVGYMLMAELLRLSEAVDIDPQRLPQCLKGGMADSSTLQRILPQMAARDFVPPRGTARQLDKDLQAVGQLIDQLGLDLPVMRRSISLYHDWASDGHGDADSAAVATRYV